MAKLTEEEKAARRQAKQAAEAARWEQERIDKALMMDALRDVLKDKTATPAQRLYAVACLNYSMNYHIAPYGLQHPDRRDDADFTKLRARFATELAEAQTSDR